MDINELESFKMSDAVKFHDELNPNLWINGKLDPKVREQLLLIADDFITSLGIPNLDVVDITVSGSNAAYSYTQHSDLDLHVLVDMSKLRDNEVYRELFTAKKTLYNDAHDITIHGVPVELYVQDIGIPVKSLGEYSVLNDKWIRIPKKQRANFDQAATKAKFDNLAEIIMLALKTQTLSRVEKSIDTIKRYRQAGLDKGGEFSPENLAYKAIRTQGGIDALYNLRDKLHSDRMSIEEASSREDAILKIKKLMNTSGRTAGEKANINSIVSKMMQQWNIQPDEVGIKQPVDRMKAKIAKAEYERIMAADLFKGEWERFKKGIFAEEDQIDEDFNSKQQVINYFVSRGKSAAQGASAWERGWRGPKPKEAKPYDPARYANIRSPYVDEDYDPNGPPPGPEFKPTMPAGTVKVDVSDVYDWYKLGQHISNLHGLGKHDFGKGPPSTILSFGDEETEHKYIQDLEKTGLTTTDIDPVDVNQPKGMKRQKVDPTYNVNEAEPTKPTTSINFRTWQRGGVPKHSFVVVRNGTEIAYGEISKDNEWDDDRRASVQEIVVHPKYRRKGFATKIYNEIERKFNYKLHPSDDVKPDGQEFWKARGNLDEATDTLDVTFTQEPYEGWNGMGAMITAYWAGNDIGHVIFEPTDHDKNKWYATEVEVEDQFQRKGIATTMYDMAKKLAQKANAVIVPSHAQTSDAKGMWKDKNVWEASGYIPSEKQKNDPRFKTALTVDVKPDAIKKNAKAFGFKTSRAGIPPQARADGKIAEELMKKYREFLGEQQEEMFPGYDEQHREKRLSNWLAKSWAVKDGKPQTFYHATTKDFDTFNMHGTGFASALGMAYEVERHGSFFAVDPKFAEDFIEDPNTGRVKEGGRVLPVHLSIQSPIDLRDDALSRMLSDEETVDEFKANDIDLRSIYNHMYELERWELFDGPEGAAFVENLQKLGFDGAIINESIPNNSNAKSGQVWVAFNPSQVKSTHNRGSFSPDDPRLTKESG